MDVITQDMLKDLVGPNTEGTRKIHWNQAEELKSVGKKKKGSNYIGD